MTTRCAIASISLYCGVPVTDARAHHSPRHRQPLSHLPRPSSPSFLSIRLAPPITRSPHPLARLSTMPHHTHIAYTPSRAPTPPSSLSLDPPHPLSQEETPDHPEPARTTIPSQQSLENAGLCTVPPSAHEPPSLPALPASSHAPQPAARLPLRFPYLALFPLPHPPLPLAAAPPLSLVSALGRPSGSLGLSLRARSGEKEGV